jgi:hypothetical protein
MQVHDNATGTFHLAVDLVGGLSIVVVVLEQMNPIL